MLQTLEPIGEGSGRLYIKKQHALKLKPVTKEGEERTEGKTRMCI